MSSYVIKFDVSPFIHLLLKPPSPPPPASNVMFSDNNNVKRINKVNCIIAHFLLCYMSNKMGKGKNMRIKIKSYEQT